MYQGRIGRIEDFDEIEVQIEERFRGPLLSLIEDSVRLAITCSEREPGFEFGSVLPRSINVRLATSSAAMTVSTLLAAASVKCHRDCPPKQPEDIEMKLDSSGYLIYRCYHDPAHEWDLTGKPK